MTTVVIQRGHVPRTRGATGAPGEQQFAINTAAAIEPMLKGMGHTVRVIDADPPLSSYRGDIFVSIHYDSAGSSSASGASVGYQSGEGRALAAAWKKHYQSEGWSRGFRPDNYTANLGQYYGVRNAIGQGNRAAIITESGFHTNAGDRAAMSPTLTARSIALAIGEITGTRPTPPEEDDMPRPSEWTPADFAALREGLHGQNKFLTHVVPKGTDKDLSYMLRSASTDRMIRSMVSGELIETHRILRYTHKHAATGSADIKALTAIVLDHVAATSDLDPEQLKADVQAAVETGVRQAMEAEAEEIANRIVEKVGGDIDVSTTALAAALREVLHEGVGDDVPEEDQGDDQQ